MAEKGMQALRAALGDRPPEGLDALTAAQLEDLAGAVRNARRRQGEALAAAGERALAHVPRLLRGPIRRIVR